MALRDLSDPQAVLDAIAEFDRLGRDTFLATHQFGPSRSYLIRTETGDYDSKAIAGVAHGYPIPPCRVVGSIGVQRWNRCTRGSTKASDTRLRGCFADEPGLTGYWWVNQGTSFSAERTGGYLWASKLGRTGAAIDHHMNVERLAVGDVILHYSAGMVQAISRVTEGAIESPNPDPHGDDGPDVEGFLARSEYFDCPQPLLRDEIPLRLRLDEQGPFNRDGRAKQVYLLPSPRTSSQGCRICFPIVSGKPHSAEPSVRFGSSKRTRRCTDLDAELPNIHLGTPDSWTISRYEDQIQEDDIALFWTGGDRAGIRAMGRISGESFQRDEPRFTSGETEMAIPYRYGLVLSEPILKSQLQEDPVLGDLTVDPGTEGGQL